MTALPAMIAGSTELIIVRKGKLNSAISRAEYMGAEHLSSLPRCDDKHDTQRVTTNKSTEARLIGIFQVHIGKRLGRDR